MSSKANRFFHRVPQAFHILRYHLLSRNQPLLASYKLTYRCNLRCQQCPFYMLENPDPTFEQVLGTLDRLRERGSRLVVFEGGEPLLWRDGEHTIRDVVAEAKRRFFSVGITTNGTLPLDVGSDVLWVSLDGLRETHDRLRGAPVFERIIENIKGSKHPRLHAHITINAQNHAEVVPLIQFLRGLVRGVTVQFYYPYNGRDALFLDFDRRASLLDELMALKRQGYPILNSNAALQALKRFNLERIYLNPAMKPHAPLIRDLFKRLFERFLDDFTRQSSDSVLFKGFLNGMSADYLRRHQPAEIVRDFIAGMTDQYFLGQCPPELRPNFIECLE